MLVKSKNLHMRKLFALLFALWYPFVGMPASASDAERPGECSAVGGRNDRRIALSTSGDSSKNGARTIDKDGLKIKLDISKQVLNLDADKDDQETLNKSVSEFATYGLDFISASILATKAKQFDDGLYAAVDLAAQSGLGKLHGKSVLIKSLAEKLSGESQLSGTNVSEVIFGACQLGNLGVNPPAQIKGKVDGTVKEFLNDSLRSKPIAFYTWSTDLERIFRQDRMLQSELKGKNGISSLVSILSSDQKLKSGYLEYLRLVSKLTNPFPPDKPDLRPLLSTTGSAIPNDKIYLFPPSRAHETELMKRLYGNAPIPEGFNLANELIKRIRSGQVKLAPTKESGWYDYQTWSLESLVVPDKSPEIKYLKLSNEYRKQLEALFKGLLALTRETHIKQLEIPTCGAGAPAQEELPPVLVTPSLSLEPVATYYLRRATSYQFIHNVLKDMIGVQGLQTMHRRTASGQVKANLEDELNQMEALFSGAYLTVCEQLGFSDASLEKLGGAVIPPDRAASFQSWSKKIKDDPDLSTDVRMMVPVFYDIGRRKTKVWAFLGWTSKLVTISYAKNPQVLSCLKGTEEQKNKRRFEFETTSHILIFPVTAEVYVNSILNRQEFRQLCDKYGKASEIIKALAAN